MYSAVAYLSPFCGSNCTQTTQRALHTYVTVCELVRVAISINRSSTVIGHLCSELDSFTIHRHGLSPQSFVTTTLQSWSLPQFSVCVCTCTYVVCVSVFIPSTGVNRPQTYFFLSLFILSSLFIVLQTFKVRVVAMLLSRLGYHQPDWVQKIHAHGSITGTTSVLSH